MHTTTPGRRSGPGKAIAGPPSGPTIHRLRRCPPARELGRAANDVTPLSVIVTVTTAEPGPVAIVERAGERGQARGW